VDEFVAALDQVATIDRRLCREHVVSHFSVQRMVDGYEAVYQQLIDARFTKNGQPSSLATAGKKHS